MEEKINAISFNDRAIPIPSDYRPLYKIGHILLILYISCRAGKSSIMKLHFLCWAIKTKSNTATVKGWIKDNFSSHLYIWGIEPTVNRALLFAVSNELVKNIGPDFLITTKGNDLVKAITRDKELYNREREFLSSIGKNKITELQINKLASKFH